MDLTSKQRAQLRAFSNNLPDLVFIGKEGVTNNVLKQIKVNLFAHELIKIKIQKNANQTISEIEQLIVSECDCNVISKVGSKMVLYKRTNKKDFKHFLA